MSDNLVIDAIEQLEAAGVRPAELARWLGVDKATIGRWKDGGRVDLNRVPSIRANLRKRRDQISAALTALDAGLESMATFIGDDETPKDRRARGSPTKGRRSVKRRAS